MKIFPEPIEPTYDVAVLIGRWQIAHKGHISLFDRALAVAPKVFVVIGSAMRARDPRNPFTAAERQAQILRCIAPEHHDRIEFIQVRDYFDNAKWAEVAQAEVTRRTEPGTKIALVGYKKDQTSAYLEDFPAWRSEFVAPEHAIDATGLRDIYFGDSDPETALEVLTPFVTPGVLQYLKTWRMLPVYAERAQEHAAVKAYRKTWTAPWYLTADAVIRVSDHILLVQRAGVIGRGLWALPGGFVDAGEQLLTAAIREAQEETHLGFLPSTMRAALKGSLVLDHAMRSPRGRLVSQAFYFAFGDMRQLPEVRPQRSEVMATRWVHINDLPNYVDKMFEDHAPAINHFVGIAGY